MSEFTPPGGEPTRPPPARPPEPWPPYPSYGAPGPYDTTAQAFERARTSRKMAGWALGLSLLLCVPFAPLVGLGLGIAVLVRSQDGRDHGRGMAIAATVIGSLYLLGSIGLFVFGVVEGFREGFEDEPERNESGEVVEGGDLIPSKLRVGDCFNEPQIDDLNANEQIETELVDVVPCGGPHDAEIYHSFQLTGSEYPGQGAIDRAARACVPEFKEFVGLSYAQSRLDFVYYFPTQESWDYLDDRGIACAAIDPRRGRVSGSLKDTRR
ncbi:MAG TPA: DUF4190 domain-containing protein [Nocardioides sp.]|nr:DUF4190 domain-containing protein [Nocardioides sp.]